MFALLSLCSCTTFYIMAPLDVLSGDQKLNYQEKFNTWLGKLKDASVDGLMIDIWWGLAETSEKNYKWDGYDTIFSMVKAKGMKLIPVMSFHQCGGNVGDTCNIPLPSFVTSSSAQPFYVDADGHVDKEYISLGFDNVKITSRTPIEMYNNFMAAFASHFSSYITDGTISEIEVGLGPCGELRYPSYQSAYWSYPGCGEFQSFDSKMKAQLSSDASAAGYSSYGHNPTNAGNYNVQPGGSNFWQDSTSDGYKSDYGQWYIKWYSKQLYQHAQSILKVARSNFPSTKLSGKISGIHWWYMTSCHCAETTAGMDNFYFYNGYRDIATAFKTYDADICFTCLEMTESSSAGSNPPYLVQQVLDVANWAGLEFEGENALAVYDTSSYSRIRGWVKKGLSVFTYLRLGDAVMSDSNYYNFKQFVSDVHNKN